MFRVPCYVRSTLSVLSRSVSLILPSFPSSLLPPSSSFFLIPTQVLGGILLQRHGLMHLLDPARVEYALAQVLTSKGVCKRVSV